MNVVSEEILQAKNVDGEPRRNWSAKAENLQMVMWRLKNYMWRRSDNLLLSISRLWKCGAEVAQNFDDVAIYDLW